jgi:hypothetical protein
MRIVYAQVPWECLILAAVASVRCHHGSCMRMRVCRGSVHEKVGQSANDEGQFVEQYDLTDRHDFVDIVSKMTSMLRDCKMS